MKRLSIEAFEDRSHPTGGHAVMLLRGLDRLPEPAVFRLNIIDAAPENSTAPRLSAGNLKPTSMRLTPEGVEFNVGPDITACPQLLPGIAVEIEVPAVPAKGGFLWPAIAPARRPVQRSGIFKRQPRPKAPGEPAPGSLIILPAARYAITAASPHGLAADHQGHQHKGNGYAATNGTATVDTREDNSALQRPAEAAADAARHFGDVGSSTIRWQPHGHAERDSPASGRRSVPSASIWRPKIPGLGESRRISFVGAVAASVLVIELALAAWHGDRLQATHRPASASVVTDQPSDASNYLIQDWLRAGSRSPRGIPVAGITAGQALERANQSLLTGSQGRDTDEGIFWLKHFLSATSGETITVRAITQLGSAYAEPTRGPPDYEHARQLWQASAALGDPLAMCFLATLFNKGLGVTIDAAVGSNWLERARRAGGCGDTLGNGGFHEH